MEEEGDGDDGDAGGMDGKYLVADGFGHDTLQFQHGRDGRSVQIDVEQADLMAFHGEADGEIDGACAFADAALAGQHDDLMLDFSELFGDGFGGGVLPAASVFLGGAGGAVVCAFRHDVSFCIYGYRKNPIRPLGGCQWRFLFLQCFLSPPTELSGNRRFAGWRRCPPPERSGRILDRFGPLRPESTFSSV